MDASDDPDDEEFDFEPHERIPVWGEVDVIRVDVPLDRMAELATRLRAAAPGLDDVARWMEIVPYPSIAADDTCHSLVAFDELVGFFRECGARFGAEVRGRPGIKITIGGIAPLQEIEGKRPLRGVGRCVHAAWMLVWAYENPLEANLGIPPQVPPEMPGSLRDLAEEIDRELGSLKAGPPDPQGAADFRASLTEFLSAYGKASRGNSISSHRRNLDRLVSKGIVAVIDDPKYGPKLFRIPNPDLRREVVAHIKARRDR